jgi:phage terminase small subunit
MTKNHHSNTLHPPAHLGPNEKQTWTDLQREFAIDDPAGLTLLGELAEAMQRAREAREAIRRDGLIVVGPTGGRRPHPAVGIERDARRGVLAALAALQLDVEHAGRHGRPTAAESVLRRIR